MLSPPLNCFPHTTKVGASEMDIGWIGFIMSLGSLLLSPIAGLVLDARGPFIPLVVTAAGCSLGCLVRGAAFGRCLRCGGSAVGSGAARGRGQHVDGRTRSPRQLLRSQPSIRSALVVVLVIAKERCFHLTFISYWKILD
jgi:hypothetical protein